MHHFQMTAYLSFFLIQITTLKYRKEDVSLNNEYDCFTLFLLELLGILFSINTESFTLSRSFIYDRLEQFI